MICGFNPISKASEFDKCYRYIYKEDFSTFWRIIAKDIQIPEDAKNLINNLIKRNAKLRFSFEDIYKSKFYNGEIDEYEKIQEYIQH